MNRRKRLVLLLLLSCVLPCMTGCAGKSRFQIVYMDYFDTVTTLTGYAASQEEFASAAALVEERLGYYHKLFDIYHTYDDLPNAALINEMAGTAPVAVAEPLLDLLSRAQSLCVQTDGKLNVLMGSVLSLWKQADTEPPACDALEQAGEHTDITALQIDRAAGTVYISDSLARLDLGAVGKGYALEAIASELRAKGISGYLLAIGGSVESAGDKQGSPWEIGISDPDNGGTLMRLYASGKAVATSGSYARFFTGADGTRYHHIIDPDTLMPLQYWTSVTVVTDSSFMADALSTALFNMDEGCALALLASLPSADALFVRPDGTMLETEGFARYRQK